MPEIDRVKNAIGAHFEIIGGDQSKKVGDIKMVHNEKLMQLVEPIERCIFMAETRWGAKMAKRSQGRPIEITVEEEALRVQIEAAKAEVEKLKEIVQEGNASAELFLATAETVMVARRATYPLENPDAPWSPPTAEKALHDDNDIHSFAIFDSLVEPIQELLPPLHQLAVEDWEDETEETA